MKPNRPLIVILSTVALDAVGIGLIMPVLPGLLRDLVHSNDVTAHYGILLALYALMQFACAPVLGALSDRFGRRPVLLVSLAGAAVDYAIMATAPFLWVLYIGRIVAGITGATGAVAGAYIADITDGDERARHFGFMSACFGFGMVAGPVLGGLMGGFSPHAPFFAAAALNGLNFLTGCFLLPESHKGERRPLRREALNPLASFRWARGMTVVAALMAVFFIMQLVGQVPAALWVIFGEDRFHWDATTIGISLAAFGILHSLAHVATADTQAECINRYNELLGKGALVDDSGQEKEESAPQETLTPVTVTIAKIEYVTVDGDTWVYILGTDQQIYKIQFGKGANEQIMRCNVGDTLQISVNSEGVFDLPENTTDEGAA